MPLWSSNTCVTFLSATGIQNVDLYKLWLKKSSRFDFLLKLFYIHSVSTTKNRSQSSLIKNITWKSSILAGAFLGITCRIAKKAILNRNRNQATLARRGPRLKTRPCGWLASLHAACIVAKLCQPWLYIARKSMALVEWNHGLALWQLFGLSLL